LSVKRGSNVNPSVVKNSTLVRRSQIFVNLPVSGRT
jgi:hypothetical protein